MISQSGGKLYGASGGQLEYVSQRIEWKKRENSATYYPVMIVRFTDHDVQWGDRQNLIEGRFYELEFPIHME